MENIELEADRLKKVKGKSIESLYRTLSKNNYRMLQMVDRKSGILVSLNAIIISLLISLKSSTISVAGLTHTPEIILISSSISLVLSLMAIRPFMVSSASVLGESHQLVNIEAIRNSTIQEYKSKMNTILKDDNQVYEAMTEDIFFIGKNIDRKHKILQLSAGVFVLGHIISALSGIFF